MRWLQASGAVEHLRDSGNYENALNIGKPSVPGVAGGLVVRVSKHSWFHGISHAFQF